MSSAPAQLLEHVDALLEGIDRHEQHPEGGWWRTSSEAAAGALILAELKATIEQHWSTRQATP